MRSFMSCIAMVLASVASVPANAQVAVVDLTAGDDTNVEYAPALAVPPEVAATTSLDFDGATAYGYANASTGILRGYATPATGISGFAYSSDTIEDSVLFSAGVGEAAAITYHWDGDLDPYSGQLYIAEATLGIGIYYADGTSLTQNYDLDVGADAGLTRGAESRLTHPRAFATSRHAGLSAPARVNRASANGLQVGQSGVGADRSVSCSGLRPRSTADRRCVEGECARRGRCRC
jgi:hypothetical protein